MRITATVLGLFLLFTATTAHACGPQRSQWQLTLLASEIGEISDSWTKSDTPGYAVALAYSPVERWDFEFTAGSKSYRSPYTQIIPTGAAPPLHFIAATTWRPYTVKPLELTFTRRFATQSRVAPYVRAGVRYVAAPKDPETPWSHNNPSYGNILVLGYNFDDRQSLQAGAGLRLRLTPRAALRAEVMRLLRNDAVPFDPLTRASMGVEWKF